MSQWRCSIRPIRSCEHCGSSPLAPRRTRWCSKKCQYQAEPRKGYPVTNCETCGVELVSGSSQPMRFCDDHRPPKSLACKTRRDRIRGGDAIDNQTVFIADGWRCGICEGPVDSDLRFPDPMAASLDHVISLAAGGTHTYDNVQCAHWTCNCRKAAKTAA